MKIKQDDDNNVTITMNDLIQATGDFLIKLAGRIITWVAKKQIDSTNLPVLN